MKDIQSQSKGKKFLNKTGNGEEAGKKSKSKGKNNKMLQKYKASSFNTDASCMCMYVWLFTVEIPFGNRKTLIRT